MFGWIKNGYDKVRLFAGEIVFWTGVAGTLGIGGATFAYAKKIADWQVLIFVVLLLGCTLFYLAWLLRKQSRNHERACAAMHFVCHTIRHMMMQLRRLELGRVALQEKLEDECDKICNELSDVMTQIHGVKCAVCIKLFWARQDSVVTFSRDDKSGQIRGTDRDMEHPIDKNTDFHVIMTGSDPAKPYFYCADLKNYPHYINDRHDWNKFYNCALVLPIQYKTKNRKAKLAGFLCIDSLGTFPEHPVKEYLASAADSLYIVMADFRQRAIMGAKTDSQSSREEKGSDEQEAAA